MGQTTSNEAAVELADLPQIQSFQFEADPFGQIRKSVNLYRGDVNLPLVLASLEADTGLTVSVTSIYDGTSCHHAETWNRQAPTGVLGLGWSLPIEQVIAVRQGAAGDAATRYYLRTASSASEMVQSGVDAEGALLFQLEGYQFWRVRFVPRLERWEVTREDGVTSIYGGSTRPGVSDGDSIQWAVAFGNWMISSAQSSGQVQIPGTWNLRQVQTPLGQTVTYDYDAITQKVGSGGKSYTKACYLSRITDSTGRSIELRYGEKLYQPGVICEYQDPHKSVADNTPDAYQSCYQTRYVDQVTVRANDGEVISSVSFAYDFFNASSGSDPNHPFLYKRVLSAIHQRNAHGDPLPGMVFDYNPPGANAQGMLKSVTYPQGATASYGYSQVTLPSARQAQINNPFTGTTPGIPRVWHGPDYTVITWVDSAGKRLKVSAYSWSGRWTDWTPANVDNADVDMTTLRVVAGGDFFAVFYRDRTTSQGVLQLYRRDPTQFGTWSRTTQSRAMNPGAPRTTIAFGDDFVVVSSPQFIGGVYLAAWWDWRKARWTVPALPSVPMASPAMVSVAGIGPGYVVCSYNPANGTGAFQLITLNDGQWSVRGWNASMNVFQDGAGDFPFAWSPLPSGAVATFVSTYGSSSATARMLTFQWDAAFNPISPGSPVTTDLSTPVVNGEMVVDLLATASAGATVGNGPQLSRFVGGGVTDWAGLSLETTVSASASYAFAYGPDSGAMVKTINGQSTASFTSFNPNTPNASGWSRPISVSQAAAVTLAEGLATLGSAVYQAQPGGNWLQTGVLLAAQGRTVNVASVQNRAPDYVLYEDTGGENTLTYVALLQNGVLHAPISLAPTPQRVTAPGGGPGLELAGQLAFVTYPAGSSLDAAPFVTLYRVVEKAVTGALRDAAVTSLSVANGFDDGVNPTLTQAYRYATNGMTLDTASGLAQYPMASVIGGVTDPNGPTPFGRTDYYYSNGFAQDARAFYTAGWVWNYTGLLNGALLATVARDDKGAALSTDVSWYQIFNSTADAPNLFGAYARRVRRTSMLDGVQSVSDTTYDSRSGLPTVVTSSSFLDGVAERTYRQTTTYAFQLEVYASAMRSAWLLKLPAQVVVESDGKAVSAQATTYRNWSSNGGFGWASERNCTWSGVGSGQFDFTPGARNSDWLTDKVVLARNAAGRVTASADAMGMVTSYIFDTTGHFQIAGFTNADTTGAEAAFTGFETYEAPTDWAVDAGTTLVSGDAHTGSCALSVPAGITGLSGDFTAAAGDLALSAWVKTPPGFASDGGQACWEVTVAGGAPTRIEIEDTDNAWAPLVARISAPVGSAATFRLINAKANSALLIDDVRVGPFAGGFSARAIDPDRRRVLARLDGAVATRKFLYDAYGQKSATLGPGLASCSVQQLMSDGLSRETTALDRFNPDAPNLRHSYAAMGPGAYLDLGSGVNLPEQYVATPAGKWSRSAQGVQFTGGLAGTLVAAPPELAAPCVFRFGLDAAQPLAGPVSTGLSLGEQDTVTVRFDPDHAGYVLELDGTEAGRARAPILALPVSDAAVLDSGRLTDDIVAAFQARGWSLSDAGVVTPRRAGASWTIQDGEHIYYVAADTDGLPVAVTARQWTLTATSAAVVFVADGLQLFGVATTAAQGRPTVRTADAVTLTDLVIATRPQTAVTFSDGAGRKVQAQSLHGDRSIVQQSVYDAVSSRVAQTKSAEVAPDGRMLLGYVGPFVTALDRQTGAMAGLVADAHPDDQGYPYSGTRYDASPLARLVEVGGAGKDFAINLTQPIEARRTTKYEYGANAAIGALPAGQYRTTTTISPRGIRSTAFVDKTLRVQVGRVMGDGPQALQTFYSYDALGNVSAVRSPNAYAPPGGSTPDDWVMTFSYDTQGRILSQSTPNQGLTEFVYDPCGRLRFTLSAEGRAKGYVVYNKYDALGRPIEVGACETALTLAELQAKAATDPAWPVDGAWQKRMTWDGDGQAITTIGQIAVAETANASPGLADVVESFAYDISGRVLGKTSRVGGRQFSFGYVYDTLGNVTSVAYPADAGVGTVTYGLDDLSRIVTVGTPANPAAYSQYAYRPDGGVETETFQPDSHIPIVRAIGHNPRGWIDSVTATGPAGTIFAETLDYTSGGWPDGQGWYDGSVAAIDFDYAGVEAPYGFRLDYDDQGQLVAAKDTAGADADFGIAKPTIYDANGNLRATSVGETTLEYIYAPGSGDRLQSVEADDPALARAYDYDLNGSVIGVSGERKLVITYDRTTALPLGITTPTCQINYAYDGSGRRIAKTGPASKVYGYGASPQPLVEWIGPDGTPTGFIQGPAGLAAVIRNGQVFYVFRDHQRSPRVLCNVDGSIAASFDYRPFGAVARETGDPDLLDRRFTGQEYDAETGLYNYRSRLYDAEVGRFLAPDPKNQFFSPYIYAANNPLSFVDPTGQFAILAALVEGLADLIGIAIAASAETVETVATVSATTTAVAEGGETLAIGSEAIATTGEVASSTIATSEEIGNALGTATVESTTTSLSEASSLGIETAEIDGASVGSLNAESGSTVSRYYSPGEWLRWFGDQGGVTTATPRNWTSWPLTYLNQWGLTAYDPVVTITDAPGTFGYIDTAAHEGFHALVFQYAPFVTWVEDATVGGVNVGAPVLWAEETVAYSVGHLAAGRIFAVPFAPLEAFGSMTGPQGVVTVAAMGLLYAFL